MSQRLYGHQTVVLTHGFTTVLEVIEFIKASKSMMEPIGLIPITEGLDKELKERVKKHAHGPPDPPTCPHGRPLWSPSGGLSVRCSEGCTTENLK